MEEINKELKNVIDNNTIIKDNLLNLIKDNSIKSDIKEIIIQINESLNRFLSVIKNNYEKSFQLVEAGYKSIQNSNSDKKGGADEVPKKAEDEVSKKAEDEVPKKAEDEVPKKTEDVEKVKVSDELENLLNNAIDNLKLLNSNYLLPLRTDTILENNPNMSSMAVDPSLFERLYNSYINRKNKVGDFIASKELHGEMSSYSLLAREALEISMIDKAIFVFVIMIIRFIALQIIKALVLKNKIHTINVALFGYLGMYILIFIAFVMFVNLDMYRLRIVFNYVNMHAHINLILTHVAMAVGFSLMISYIINIVNIPKIKTSNSNLGSEISNINKDTILYRLEIITGITFLFLAILVFA
jgi:hypothetical protein